MDARTRKRLNREARATRVKNAREVWGEEEFGLSMTQHRSGARVTWNVDRDPFIALMSLDRMRRVVLDGLEVELVLQLRMAGESWEDIGVALDVSGEAIRKRLGGPVGALEDELAGRGTRVDREDDE
jgi:hypothetical protein